MILTVQKCGLLLLGDCTRAIPDDEDDAALLSKVQWCLVGSSMLCRQVSLVDVQGSSGEHILNDVQDGGDSGSNTSEALIANVQCSGYLLRKL
jgi:hypothetical protein